MRDVRQRPLAIATIALGTLVAVTAGVAAATLVSERAAARAAVTAGAVPALDSAGTGCPRGSSAGCPGSMALAVERAAEAGCPWARAHRDVDWNAVPAAPEPLRRDLVAAVRPTGPATVR